MTERDEEFLTVGSVDLIASGTFQLGSRKSVVFLPGFKNEKKKP